MLALLLMAGLSSLLVLGASGGGVDVTSPLALRARPLDFAGLAE